MNALIDTNVISEFTRPQPSSKVLRWASQEIGFYLSVISLEELYYGLTWKPNAKITSWLAQFIQSYCQILPISQDIAEVAGKLRGNLQAQGETRTQADILIAATALSHNLNLVTRNDKDFIGTGVRVINPF